MKITKICVCGKEFRVFPYRFKTAKYCSQSCNGIFTPRKKGYKNPAGSLAKMGSKNPQWGKKRTLEERKNLSDKMKQIRKNHPEKYKDINKGSKNHNWKGNDVGYSALHDWVKATLGSPDKCIKCGFKSTSNRKIHWANKSGKYLRIKSDWIRLCVKCHSKYDRHRKVLQENRKRKAS